MSKKQTMHFEPDAPVFGIQFSYCWACIIMWIRENIDDKPSLNFDEREEEARKHVKPTWVAAVDEEIGYGFCRAHLLEAHGLLREKEEKQTDEEQAQNAQSTV